MQTRAARRLITYCSLVLLIISVLFGATRMAAAQTQPPTIASDLADYNPGGWVTLTGTGWLPNATVHIVVNDDVGQTWSRVVDVPVAADGAIKDVFQLPNWFVATYFVTASGNVSGSAVTTFADPNPSANLDQCANDPAPSPNSDGCNTAASQWVNGNLGGSKAFYFEGDSIPYRLTFDNLSLAPHTVIIGWDTTKSGTHALDYLTSYNYSVLNADPCLGVSGCSTSTTFPIPADPQVTNAGVTPAAGNFTLFGGTISAVSAYTYPVGTGFAGDKSAQIAITFTPTQANPVLAWGGHISSRQDWGMNNSAVAIPGSPYHTNLVDLDGSGGSQDRSLSADAVIFPGSITIIKDATPNGSTSFPFTASPAPLGDFSLVDDGTPANTKVFSKITSFQTYTVAESVPAGWDLTGVVCTVTSPNGGSQSVSGATSTINLNEGENVTCTYSDLQQKAHLIVIKHVINDNGGTAAASDFTMSVAGGSPSPASFAGVEAPGTPVTLDAGSYSVSETGPAGYTASYSTDCTGTLAAGETKTCTVTNDDQQAYVIVNKVVINDNGGAALADDFKLTLDGNATTSGTKVAVSPGTHTAGETQLSGYSFTGYSGDCNTSGEVTVALGETKTCTLTNDDQPSYVIVNKVVVNNNGGSAQPDDFKLTLNNNSVTSGAKVAVTPGTFTAGETQLSGYTFTGFSGDCDSSGKVTVALGETKSCTLTNDDQPSYVIVNKVVVNNNGGSALPDDFKLTLNGNSITSGTKVAVTPGTFTAAETQLPGYSFTGYSGDCDSSGKVTVALGETKTCTLTNDDQQAYVIVNKVVVNDNGGAAQPDDFKLTLNNNSVTSGAKVAVTPGTYTASETLLSGYSFTGYSGDCNTSGEVTVALGETKTCTLTNDDQPSYVIVNKVVVNDNGGSALPDDFKLTLNDNSVTSGAKVAVTPGTYTAGETQLSGYTFTGFSGDCDVDGKVTVALGETKTCTLTNDDQQAYVIVNKVVVNDNGGAAQPDDFKLTLDGSATTSGTPVAVNPGAYTAGETQVYGYSFTGFSGDCDTSGKVTVALGETKSCTLTNDDLPGTIVVKKIIKPVGALTSFTFNTTGKDYNGFALAGGQQNSQTLNAGSYSVMELVPLGWVLTGIGGSTDPNTPYNCAVTGSGGSTGLGDLKTQTATIDLKNGDTVTCVFENTGQGVTRTQGFWATHPQLANIAWFGGTDFGHTFPGVTNTAGINDMLICGRPVDSLDKLMSGFWSDISKTSTGAKRSSLDQAKMQLLQQLLAAELNASAFGSVPGKGSFAAWESALCGNSASLIKTAQQQAASFNTQGDSGTFTPGTSADSKTARALANKALDFWDVFK